MPNRLAGSSSPYLLQHQTNPVDWFPWCEDALAKSVAEDKPIFLSIGYSACHWCHVMEHESFENTQIAALLNEHFVSIKVDREQRPDLDQIYMQAVQIMTGSGGWPMSVFLTPAKQPFFGGTYWPPETKYGRPGFAQVLASVIEAWREKRDAIESQCCEMVQAIQQSLSRVDDSSTALWNPKFDDLNAIDDALSEKFDSINGGFGPAPKFPHATELALLTRIQKLQPTEHRQHVIERTLTAMADGGIYDQLGGGFSRYSVDAEWLVPHFEKMLYDNALLVLAYAEAFDLSRNARFESIVHETLGYLIRDMRNSSGGFHSAEDADSEGVEGKFYVWSREEVYSVLGDQAELFCEFYDVTFGGNFEGSNILRRVESIDSFAAANGQSVDTVTASLSSSRKKLLEIRNERIRPGLDDKALTSWNALAIAAYAKSAMVFERPEYAEIAVNASEFLLNHLRNSDGRLLHVWREGKSEISAFLDDYAYTIEAFVLVAESSGELRFLDAAKDLANQMRTSFGSDSGAFYFTSDDSEALIARAIEWTDHSIPSSNGSAALALIRLGTALGDETFVDAGLQVLTALRSQMQRAPTAAAQMWLAAEVAASECYRDLLFVDDATDPEIEVGFKRTTTAESIRLIVHPDDKSVTARQLATLLIDGTDLPVIIRCHGNRCEPIISGTAAVKVFLN